MLAAVVTSHCSPTLDTGERLSHGTCFRHVCLTAGQKGTITVNIVVNEALAHARLASRFAALDCSSISRDNLVYEASIFNIVTPATAVIRPKSRFRDACTRSRAFLPPAGVFQGLNSGCVSTKVSSRPASRVRSCKSTAERVICPADGRSLVLVQRS